MKKIIRILVTFAIILSGTSVNSMDLNYYGEICYNFLENRGIVNQELDFSDGVTRRDFFRCLYVIKQHSHLITTYEEVIINDIKKSNALYNFPCFSDVDSLSKDECFAYSLYIIGLLQGNADEGIYTVDFDENIKLGDAIVGLSRLFSKYDMYLNDYEDFHGDYSDGNYYEWCFDYLTTKGVINNSLNPMSIKIEKDSLYDDLKQEQFFCMLYTALFTPYTEGCYELTPGSYYIREFETEVFVDQWESFSDLMPSIYY